MSSRSERQGQGQSTEAVEEKDYALNELFDFILAVQEEADIDDEVIEKITGEIQLHDIRMKSLRETDEFGKEFLEKMAFNMCFLDLQTEEGIVHQNAARKLKDAFRWKEDPKRTPKEDTNAWIFDIFCYDDLKRLTPFALAVTLLDRITDLFYAKLDKKGMVHGQFTVSHYGKEKVESGFHKATEILLPLVLEIFRRFPDVSLNFIISGVSTEYPEPQKLATLVLMLGRLMKLVGDASPKSRMKMVFCGNGFLKPFAKNRVKEIKKEDTLLFRLKELAEKQGEAEIQDRIVKSITDRMLILRWSEKEVKWLRPGFKGEITSNALVLVGRALADD